MLVLQYRRGREGGTLTLARATSYVLSILLAPPSVETPHRAIRPRLAVASPPWSPCRAACRHLRSPGWRCKQVGSTDGWKPWVFNALIAVEINQFLELGRLPLVIATTPRLAAWVARAGTGKGK